MFIEALGVLKIEKRQKTIRYYGNKLLLLFLQRALKTAVPTNSLVLLKKTLKIDIDHNYLLHVIKWYLKIYLVNK